MGTSSFANLNAGATPNLHGTPDHASLRDIYNYIYRREMTRTFDCDPAKREWLGQERGFDLLDLVEIFADQNRIDVVDTRFDYGEERHVTIGRALGGIFTVVYTMREPVTWLITAWPAHRKERDRYASR